MQINLEELYQKEAQFLSELQPKTYAPGKSIVTTCYDAEFPSAWVMLKELSRLGCKLPIEIFHKESELSQKQIDILCSVIPGQVVVKIIQGEPKDYISRYGHRHGWACKIYALFESEYAENLWIDADNCPIVNPEFLFNDPEYVQKGSLFWRDIMSPDSANQYADQSIMWPIFNVAINDGEPFETGQLLIDKNRCATEFNLIKYYTDRCELYYSFGGDKEAFKLAWQRIGQLRGIQPARINYHADPRVPYGFIPYGPYHKGDVNQYKKWGGGSVMVQRDREGNELFNHRNLSKFRLTNNTYMKSITNEDFYHKHLKDLEEAYNV